MPGAGRLPVTFATKHTGSVESLSIWRMVDILKMFILSFMYPSRGNKTENINVITLEAR